MASCSLPPNLQRIDSVILGIVPVRAGSKSIPQKNLQYVNGATLVQRATLFALSVCDWVVISSDSNQILENASLVSSENCILQLRSSENAQDKSSSESVVIEVLSRLDKDIIESIRIIAIIQATSPFQDVNAFKSAKELILDGKFDSVFASSLDKKFRWKQQAGFLSPLGHTVSFRPMRQDYEGVYVETGGFYLFKKEKFLHELTRFCGNVGNVITSPSHNIDIDEPYDLMVANLLSKSLDAELTYLRGSHGELV